LLLLLLLPLLLLLLLLLHLGLLLLPLLLLGLPVRLCMVACLCSTVQLLRQLHCREPAAAGLQLLL
jgi:hypothetical protein